MTTEPTPPQGDTMGASDRLLRRVALAFAARGCAVFPCVPRGKAPACAHGCLDATTNTTVITRWWQGNPDYNIAIACGQPSRVVVLDIDGPDGEAALRKLEAEHGALPQTVEAITTRGRHLYFKAPAARVPNSAGQIADYIDVRGDGGYVLVPPSVHPTGKRYCWSVDSASTIAEMPAWLLTRLVESDPSIAPTAAPPSEWLELVRGVTEGTRNDSVAKLTGHLLRHYVHPHVTLELVRTWNAARCSPPLADAEVVQTVKSIASKELRRRQGQS
jgi:Bifunctional DNA primase/polymerase, N-terminal/Primase C terminal 1 (PriCT-1)